MGRARRNRGWPDRLWRCPETGGKLITGKIIGAAIRVHGNLGPGLLESGYQKPLAVELGRRGLSFERERTIPIECEDVRAHNAYRIDFLVEEAGPRPGHPSIRQLNTDSAPSGEDAGALAAGISGKAAAGAERERYLGACLEAAERLDAQALREELMRAVVQLSAPLFVTGVVGPLLDRVGELWEAGEMRPAEEHVVSTAVRQVLDWLLGRYEASRDAPLLVVGTPAGELHEFGAMLAAVVAVSVVDGVEADRGRAVRELESLRRALPEGVLLVAGGRRSEEVEMAGVTRVADLDALRQVLAAARPENGGGG